MFPFGRTILIIAVLITLAFQVSGADNKTKITRVPEKVLRGTAIKKVWPPKCPAAGCRCAGSVQALVIIDAFDGKVREVKILTGHPLLRAAALDAARQWRWKPALITTDSLMLVEGVLTFKFKC